MPWKEQEEEEGVIISFISFLAKTGCFQNLNLHKYFALAALRSHISRSEFRDDAAMVEYHRRMKEKYTEEVWRNR